MTSLKWESATEWDSAQSESGVVHENVANTDHDNDAVVKKGYSAASPFKSSSLVRYLPLHEDSGSTAYDFSPSAVNGSYVGNPSLGNQGLLGTTHPSLDGADDYVDLNYNPSNNPLSEVTISVWFRIDSITSDINEIIRAIDSNSHQWQLELDGSNNWDWFVYDGSSSNGITAASLNLNTGTWYHFVATFDGSTYRIYVDGVEEASANNSTWVNPNQNHFLGAINTTNETGGNYWPGDFWDFRIYDVALTASEVQTLYDVVNTAGSLTTAKKTS